MAESFATKPALYLLTRATISACFSIGCEQNINASPPSRARAIAIESLETDCIQALVNGMLIDSGASSPFLNLQSGVLKDTFEGTQFSEEYVGISKYSENVCEGSLK